jgi:hypothetical protein
MARRLATVGSVSGADADVNADPPLVRGCARIAAVALTMTPVPGP